MQNNLTPLLIMEFTAKQIAQFIQGRVEGDENTTVHTFAKIEEGTQGAISFLSSPKYSHYAYETKSSIILIDEAIMLDKPVQATLIRVKDARDCVARLLQLYEASKPRRTGIDSLAFVSPDAQVGKDVYIGPFACIEAGAIVGDGCMIYPHVVVGENVKIGANCKLYPNVTIYHDCQLGNNVVLHAGTVIGADGFGFAPSANGYDKIPQIGIVTIEDDVEIGANSCVDRSTMGSTYIRKGAKIDNLVQIAHNVDVGQNTVMSAQVGIAGSTKVGEWCMFGGQVGIAGHITIGDRVMLGAQSGVPGSLKSDQTLIGTPPMNQMAFFKAHALSKRLPDLFKEVDKLKKEIEELKRQRQ